MGYIGVITHLLTSMDIQVDDFHFPCLVGFAGLDSLEAYPRPPRYARKHPRVQGYIQVGEPPVEGSW